MQISFLVYPGTSGSPAIDYIVVDAVVAPPEHARWFTEKLIYMPGTYQVGFCMGSNCFSALQTANTRAGTVPTCLCGTFLCGQVNHYSLQSVLRADAGMRALLSSSGAPTPLDASRPVTVGAGESGEALAGAVQLHARILGWSPSLRCGMCTHSSSCTCLAATASLQAAPLLTHPHIA